MSKTAVYTLTEIRNKIYLKSREKEHDGEWFSPHVAVANEVIEWIDDYISECGGELDDDYDINGK